MRALFEYSYHIYTIDEEKNTSGPIEIAKMTYFPGDVMCCSDNITGAINTKRIDKKDLCFYISSSNEYVAIYSDKINYRETTKLHSLNEQVKDLCELTYSNQNFKDVSEIIDTYYRMDCDEIYDEDIVINGTTHKCSDIHRTFEELSNMIKDVISDAPRSERIVFCSVLCEYTEFKKMLPSNILPMTPFKMAEKLLEYMKEQM